MTGNLTFSNGNYIKLCNEYSGSQSYATLYSQVPTEGPGNVSYYFPTEGWDVSRTIATREWCIGGFIDSVYLTSVSFTSGTASDINIATQAGKGVREVLCTIGYGTRDKVYFAVTNGSSSSYTISMSLNSSATKSVAVKVIFICA